LTTQNPSHCSARTIKSTRADIMENRYDRFELCMLVYLIPSCYYLITSYWLAIPLLPHTVLPSTDPPSQSEHHEGSASFIRHAWSHCGATVTDESSRHGHGHAIASLQGERVHPFTDCSSPSHAAVASTAASERKRQYAPGKASFAGASESAASKRLGTTMIR